MFLLNQQFKTLRKGRTRFEIPDMHDYSAVHFLSRLFEGTPALPETINQGILP
jgi:hypothetical protein